MRLVYLLLHDFRFASLSLREFAYQRFHFAKEYARRMAQLGHDVKLYVFADEVKGREAIRIDGYELKAFGVSLRFPPVGRFGNDHSVAVLRELGSDAPDLVHFHNYYLWNFPYTAAWARRNGTRLVAQYHGTDPLRPVKTAAFLPALELCERVLVPLESEFRLLTGALHIRRARVTLLPSTGVDTSVFLPARRRPAGLSLLYVGRVPRPASYVVERAPHLLIPILRALSDSGLDPHLTVAGDGPGLASLEALAERFGVHDRIDFLGQVEQTRLPDLYSGSTLSFVPMQVEQIGPYWVGSLQESLACGTPVAAFSNDSPGRTRFGLFIPTDPRAAARLISEAVSDQGWLSSVREEGPTLIRENCEWGTLVRRLDSIYSGGGGPAR